MKGNDGISRRRFLSSAGAMVGTAMLRIGPVAAAAIAQAACTARDEGAQFVTLGPDEAADFAAIAARLIPTTTTPGATEAGVIHFYDRAWGDELGWALGDMRSFLETLNAASGSRFAALDADAQDATLRAHESDGRFELLRIITIFGFFAMEKYGGNKGHLSWDLIDFEGHHGAWAPPFGHYDAEYAKESADGE
jgi:hypothetical protein